MRRRTSAKLSGVRTPRIRTFTSNAPTPASANPLRRGRQQDRHGRTDALLALDPKPATRTTDEPLAVRETKARAFFARREPRRTDTLQHLGRHADAFVANFELEHVALHARFD